MSMMRLLQSEKTHMRVSRAVRGMTGPRKNTIDTIGSQKTKK